MSSQIPAEASAMTRVTSFIGFVAFIFGSLITFPAYLHWMVACWIVVSLIAGTCQRPMWPWLLICMAILIVKRPGFAVEFWILLTTLGFVAVLDWQRADKSADSSGFRRIAILSIALVLANLSFGLTRWYAANASRQLTLDDRPIVCLGDSLTDFGYPQDLANLISVPVADFGVNGIETHQGIALIPEILAFNPQLIIIELGGHDYNKGKSRTATRANLETLIQTFLKRDIFVMLVEIPRGFISDPFDGLERELAAKYDLQLIDDSVIRNLVFYGPILPPGIWLDPSRRLSEDGLHPNELGNKYFARIVFYSLKKVFGERIRR